MDTKNPTTGIAILAPKKPKRRARLSKVASARDTIRGFDHETDIGFGLTMGQFSLLDLIEAALEITGPAHVLISTWSASFYDVERAAQFRDNGQMLSCRFIMDSSDKRGQAKGSDVASLFGDDAIRTTRTHAKFVVVSNAEWNIVIQSSMNLNLNPRSEQFSMADDPTTASFVLSLAESLWTELPEGATYDRTTPTFPGVPEVQPLLDIACTPVSSIELGTVSVDAR